MEICGARGRDAAALGQAEPCFEKIARQVLKSGEGERTSIHSPTAATYKMWSEKIKNAFVQQKRICERNNGVY